MEKLYTYVCNSNSNWNWVGILFFIKRQIVIVMECEVMCNTGSITWSLHDCAFSIKTYHTPCSSQAWEYVSSLQLTSTSRLSCYKSNNIKYLFYNRLT